MIVVIHTGLRTYLNLYRFLIIYIYIHTACISIHLGLHFHTSVASASERRSAGGCDVLPHPLVSTEEQQAASKNNALIPVSFG